MEHLLTFIILLTAKWSFLQASSLEEHHEPAEHYVTREQGLYSMTVLLRFYKLAAVK